MKIKNLKPCCAGSTLDVPASLREEYKKRGEVWGIAEQVPAWKVLEKRAELHKALSDAVRLQILFTLDVMPACACILKEITGLKDSLLSYHLSILKKSGFIEGEREKNYIIYSLTPKGKTTIGNEKI